MVRKIVKTLRIETSIDGKLCVPGCPYKSMKQTRYENMVMRPYCSLFGPLKAGSPRHKKCIGAEVEFWRDGGKKKNYEWERVPELEIAF